MSTTIRNGFAYSTDGPTCPFCATTIVPDDGSYYEERLVKLTCGSCSRDFGVDVRISTSWKTFKPIEAGGTKDGTGKAVSPT